MFSLRCFPKAVVCLTICLVACSDSTGGNGIDGGNGEENGTARWSRDIAADGFKAGFHLSHDGTRDLVYYRVVDYPTSVICHTEQSGTGQYTETEIEEVLLPGFQDYMDTPSVVRDGAGTVHFVWQNGEYNAFSDPFQVRYASGKNGSFTAETLSDDAIAPVIRVGADDVPQVAYLKEVDGLLAAMYATRVNNAWVHTQVGVREDYTNIEGIGLALDPDGAPHLLFFRTPDRALVWASLEGDAFSLEVAGNLSNHSSHTRLRADFTPQGQPVILHDASYEGLALLTKTGDTWASSTAGSGYVEGSWAYAFEPSGQLLVLRSGEDSWIGTGQVLRNTEEQTFQLLARDCDTNALAVDAGGLPQVLMDCDNRSTGGRSVIVMEQIGTFSKEWEQACDQAAQAICDAGCGCNPDECCIGSFCTSSFACAGNARGHLCGDPATEESAIFDCLPAAGAGECVDQAYQLPPECDIPQFVE